MKKYAWIYVLLALLTSCKTTVPIVPLVVKDSVSVTYRPGTEQPLAICVIDEGLPEIATRASCVIEENGVKVTPGLAEQTHRAEPCSTGIGCVLTTRNKNIPRNLRNSDEGASGRLNIRVDTVIIERWHTREVCQPPSPTEQTSAIKHQTFYKNCTKGFWVLLILLLGTTAFRIVKAIYLRK